MYPAEWLKTHGDGEAALEETVVDFLDGQARRIASQVADAGHVSTALVGQVFRVDDEHEAFLEAVRPVLAGLMAYGAAAVWPADAKSVKGRWSDEVVERFQQQADEIQAGLGELSAFDLPDEVIARIGQQLTELSGQDYWRAIQATTEAELTAIIKEGAEEGYSHHKIAANIREALGGEAAQKRAMRIARTETTGALNAGHQASIDELQSLGATVTKVWDATGDGITRETHAAADGQTVDGQGLFIVGGYETPYPGHWSLPAAERVNCRCFPATDVDLQSID